MKRIRKAVIPAAGYGTRFLPATKAMPKEMLPIVDKPTIQYVVEDAVSAGIEDIIIVTGWHKRSIEDHFDYPFELLQRLEEAGKKKEADQVKRVAELGNFIYIRQKGPLGNATPIMNAREVIGDEPFIVLWGDDWFEPDVKDGKSRCQQLVEAYEAYNSCILGAVYTEDEEDTKKYAYASGVQVSDGVFKVEEIIEKPGVEKKPSNFAIVSGYVYTPEIFQAIEEATVRVLRDRPGTEVVYVDAINVLLEQNKAVYAKEIKNAKYMDTGTKINYLKTVVDIASRREDIGPEFNEFLKDFVAKKK